jgi:hypothetical protein
VPRSALRSPHLRSARPVPGRLGCVPLALALLLAPTPSTAQARTASPASCDYTACALRVQHGMFGDRLVRGSDDGRVAGMGFWVKDLDSVFEGNAAAQELAATYRGRHNTGSLLTTLGLATMVLAIATDDSDLFSTDGSAVALGLGGLTVALIGGITAQSGRDSLSRAVWEYNRGLSR